LKKERQEKEEREVPEKVIVILPQGAEKPQSIVRYSEYERCWQQFETGVLACTDTEFKRMIK
jgi:hypothetical protein